MKTRLKTPRSLLVPLCRDNKFIFTNLILSLQTTAFPSERLGISQKLQSWIEADEEVWIVYIETIVHSAQTVRGKGNIPIGIVYIINGLLNVVIHKDYNNHGYGTECAKVVLKHQFEQTDEIGCLLKNSDCAATRMLQKLGFRPRESVNDCELHSITKTEFLDLWTFEG